MDDHELLREYTESRSERAFTSLVERHLPLVYGTAQRMLREQPAAQDVAQTVFIQLANNAAKVRDGYTLPGWLYRATQRAALHALRDDHRRRQRETTAMNLAEQNNDSSVAWEKLTPLLDEALGRLNRVEQDAVLLRYFDGRSLDETGRALSLSEAAAQKRVSRALEKMRRHFARRGLTLSTILLGATLETNAKTTVPDGMVSSVSSSALDASNTASSLTLSTKLHTVITSKLTLRIAASIIVVEIVVTLMMFHQSATPVSSSQAQILSVKTGTSPIAVVPARYPIDPKSPALHPPPSAPIVPQTLKTTQSPQAPNRQSPPVLDPQADLKTALPDIIRLLRAGDGGVALMETYMTPDDRARITPEQMQQMQQTLSRQIQNGQNLQAEQAMENTAHEFESLESQTPTLNATSDEATYIFTPPPNPNTGESFAPRPLILVKINGKWYVKDLK